MSKIIAVIANNREHFHRFCRDENIQTKYFQNSKTKHEDSEGNEYVCITMLHQTQGVRWSELIDISFFTSFKEDKFKYEASEIIKRRIECEHILNNASLIRKFFSELKVKACKRTIFNN